MNYHTHCTVIPQIKTFFKRFSIGHNEFCVINIGINFVDIILFIVYCHAYLPSQCMLRHLRYGQMSQFKAWHLLLHIPRLGVNLRLAFILLNYSSTLLTDLFSHPLSTKATDIAFSTSLVPTPTTTLLQSRASSTQQSCEWIQSRF